MMMMWWLTIIRTSELLPMATGFVVTTSTTPRVHRRQQQDQQRGMTTLFSPYSSFSSTATSFFPTRQSPPPPSSSPRSFRKFGWLSSTVKDSDGDRLAAASRFSATSGRYVQHRDVVIVGGGLAGLSIALYITQLDPTRHVTVLDRQVIHSEREKQDDDHDNKNEDVNDSSGGKTTVASWAAAGMLAPHSERLPQGPLLELCEESRQLYPDFVNLVEALAQQSGREGAKYLEGNKNKNNNDSSSTSLEPWQVGYLATGGFLAPAFAGDAVATWAPPQSSTSRRGGGGGGGDVGGGTQEPAAIWLDATQVREMEPLLHPDVIGGWWFPDDASVDARRLMRCLQAACVAAGVQLLHGASYQVTSLVHVPSRQQQPLGNNNGRGLRLQGGTTLTANAIVLANGAWMQQLLPVPVEPHKGQSLALRMPSSNTNNNSQGAPQPPALRRVLFAQDCYLVPKADGQRLIVGATVEAGCWDPHVTPGGLLHVLSYALQLIPSLKDWSIEETWVGLRPTTPDKLPLFGATPWSNVWMAGGYWRNGVLLAPKTGQLMAQLIVDAPKTGQDLSSSSSLAPHDQAYLDAFAWDRLTNPETSLTVAANARYAAALHPLQQRTNAGQAGVATAVGSELGSYSTAQSAQPERHRDRHQLLNTNTAETEALFEQAAALGKRDAQAYSSSGSSSSSTTTTQGEKSLEAGATEQHQLLLESLEATQSFEGSVDAITVGSATSSTVPDADDENDKDDDELQAVYAQIRANKEAAASQTQGEAIAETSLDDDDDERPDPGFRIYHVDEETGEEWEVPPYTKPEDFFEQLMEKKVQEPQEEPTTSSSTTEEELEEKPTAKGLPFMETKEEVGQGRPQEEEAGAAVASSSSSTYNEKTFDGYTVIQQANARSSREEELQAMRRARLQNRREETDVNQVGVVDWDDTNGSINNNAH